MREPPSLATNNGQEAPSSLQAMRKHTAFRDTSRVTVQPVVHKTRPTHVSYNSSSIDRIRRFALKTPAALQQQIVSTRSQQRRFRPRRPAHSRGVCFMIICETKQCRGNAKSAWFYNFCVLRVNRAHFHALKLRVVREKDKSVDPSPAGHALA